MSGPGGVVCSGGSAPGGGESQHALRQTPLPLVDRHTLVKTLPWPNFVAASNEVQLLKLNFHAHRFGGSSNQHPRNIYC